MSNSVPLQYAAPELRQNGVACFRHRSRSDYALFAADDGLPALRKTVSVHNPYYAKHAVTVDHMTMEMLRAPNWAPDRMTVELEGAANPTPYDQQIPPNGKPFGPKSQKWHSDPEHYDQCCDQELHVSCE